MPHAIEVFVDDCPLCRETVDMVSVGKCTDCKMFVHDVTKTLLLGEKMKAYGVTSVPTIVIDGRVRVTGKPSFPWFCSDEFYRFLEANYPLIIGIQKRAST